MPPLSVSPRRRVLLVENTIRGLGGSYESLFITASALHSRAAFEPVVLFFQPNHFAEKLEAAGIRVIIESSRHFWEKESYIRGSGKVRSRLPRRGFLGALRRRSVALLRAVVGGFPMAMTVRRVIRREAVDLLHSNNNLERDSMVILGGLLAGVPVVAHERQLTRCSFLARAVSGRVRTLVCISDAVLDFSRTSGARTADRRRIYNAIDLDRVRAIRPSLPPGPPRVGILGRIMQKKGQRCFVEAAALVRRRFPDVELYIIGQATGEDRQYEEEVRALSRSLGLETSIRWTGYLSDPLPLMASLGVAVHAALEPEPFGRVIIEALALGVPVVATALGGPVEIIEEGKSGFLIPPRDPAAIADRVISLLADRGLASKIRAGALRRAEDFGVPRYITEIEKVYDAALGGASAAGNSLA